MIACGRSCFQEVSETPVATGKSGPQSWHVLGLSKTALSELRKGPAKGPGKGPAKGPPAETTEPGAEILVIFLMDGLNIWWDLWWVFDRRSEISMNSERFVGLNPIFVFFWRWQTAWIRWVFITKIFGCLCFLFESFKHGISMYFQMTCLESERWLYMIVQSNPVQHMVGWTLANKRLLACPLLTTNAILIFYHSIQLYWAHADRWLLWCFLYNHLNSSQSMVNSTKVKV